MTPAGQSESFFGIYYKHRQRVFFFFLPTFTLKNLKSLHLLGAVLLLWGKRRPKEEDKGRQAGLRPTDGHPPPR